MQDNDKATVPVKPPGNSPPREVGGFELLSKLGQGGMGAVFKARQISMDRTVALKILPPSLAKKATFTERFLREARACARLSHPNIVGGIDAGQDGGVYFFAMEYVDGVSVRNLVRQGKVSEAQVLKVGEAIARALAHAHAHGILHRDIKPDNILIDKDGTPKLCDLGLARVVSQTENEKSLTQDGTALGTPDYISPEQAIGRRDVDARSDVYSLGATLYHMLAGKVMFEGTTSIVIMTRHLTDKCPSPTELGAQVSKGLLAVLAKALAKSREDRYQSAEMMADDLARVAQRKPPQFASLPPEKWPFSGAMPAVRDDKQEPELPRKIDTGRREKVRAGPGKAAWLVPASVLVVCGIGYALFAGKNEPQAQSTVINSNAPSAASLQPNTPLISPTPARAPIEDVKRLFDSAVNFSKNKPNDFAGCIAEFEKLRNVAKGTEFERKIGDEIASIGRRRDDAIHAAALKFTGEAAALATQEKYDSAIGIWERIPKDQAELLSGVAAKAMADLRAQAETRLTGLYADADKCLAEKRWADGKKALDGVEHIEYRAWSSRLEEFRSKLASSEQVEIEAIRATAIAAAQNTFAKYLDPFVEATLKGDLKSARKIANEARADAALKELVANTQGMSELCDALDRIEAGNLAVLEKLKDGKEHSFETAKGVVKGVVPRVTADTVVIRFQGDGLAADQPYRIADFTPTERKRLAAEIAPQTPAEHLAHGIRALAAEEVPVAFNELAAVKEHPLSPPYQAKLDGKLLGVVEAAAKTAWESILRAAGTGKLSDQKAKEIADKLATFEKDHGTTKFAASIATDLAALKDRLLNAGGGWKPIAVENIHVNPRGQVVPSVENGTLVLSGPQGSGAEIPLVFFARDFRLKFEFNSENFELMVRRNSMQAGNQPGMMGCIGIGGGPNGIFIQTFPEDDPRQRVPLVQLKQPGILQPGWHKMEISVVVRTLNVAVDDKPICHEENLPAIARNDTMLFSGPGKRGKFELRNAAVALLDKETTGGTFDGIILEKGPDSVTFKTDGEDVPHRFSPVQQPGGGADLHVLDTLKNVVSLNRGKLSWKLQPDGHPAVVSIQVEPSAPNGTLSGILTFDQNNCIEVKTENGRAERFLPRWVGGMGGGHDRNIVQALVKFKVGDKVKVTWVYDDRKRVVGIEPAL